LAPPEHRRAAGRYATVAAYAAAETSGSNMTEDVKRKPKAHPDMSDDALGGRTNRGERDEVRKKALDDKLERGLEETFPGSDPVAIIQPHRAPGTGRNAKLTRGPRTWTGAAH
jgi:hypothetical protein